MLDKLKEIKKGYRKKRDKPSDKLPYDKANKADKWVRRAVKAGLFFMVFSGVISFIKANNVSHTNRQLASRIATYEKKLTKASLGQGVYSPSLDRYMQGFFKSYFSMSNQDQDKQSRLKDLKKYFATNIDDTAYGDISDNQTQSFTGASLLNTFTKDGIKIAQYQVNYDVITETEKKVKVKEKGKEVEKTEKSQNKQAISRVYDVPFMQKSGQYTVLALPFATSSKDLLAHVGEIKNSSTNNASLSSSARVQKFVKAFSEKYVSSDATDMGLIMREPEALSGQYAVQSIDNVTVSGRQSHMVIRYMLTLSDTETKQVHKEQMALTVSPKGSTYYVEKLSHTTGGLTN